MFAAGFTLKKRDFFRNFGTISVFAVAGTIISALTFGLITYALVAINIVKRSHLGTAPVIECLLYGKALNIQMLLRLLSVHVDCCMHGYKTAITTHTCVALCLSAGAVHGLIFA